MPLTGDWGRFGKALLNMRRARQTRAVVRTGEQIAGDIAERAKDKLGEYQGSVAQFPAWETLAESTLARKAADTPLYETGDLQKAITTWPGRGPNEWMVGVVPGDPSEAAGKAAERGTTDKEGAVHEPQRAFLGPAVIEAGQSITGYARGMVEAIVKEG